MLVVISPAKKLDWTARDVETTTPAFLSDANALAGTARDLTQSDLEKLMHISPDLARLNVERFRDFSDAPDDEETRPAALAFAGDTYQGLEAASLDPDEMSYAQNHLRILSGLYCVLRPLDAIQPYRLEMGSRLKNPRGKSLYDYWGDTIAKARLLVALRRNPTLLLEVRALLLTNTTKTNTIILILLKRILN